ncbi:protocadherin gamma-A11-like isoform X26 [Anguilla rostrata]|uniref:protocadherin gamma-A11-like isoform X26 n=1 Tax=Anguilla rostrata TaxID=7938 RepID=UPI0030D0EB57
MRREAGLLIASVCYIGAVVGHVRYSVPEEMTKGSFVGNIAQDLGLDTKRLLGGKARIFAGDNSEYIDLIGKRGILVVKERIDREALCGLTSPCSIQFEIVLDNPIEFHRVTVEILDINDNHPVFPKDEIRLEISESALPGARFVLESAVDPDVGVNTLRSYALKPTDHFALKVDSQPDGSKYVAMVLQTPLDREKSEEMSLLLSAVDGGDPQMSGTAKIHITVLDSNDNPPVFTQGVYKASVSENAPKGTLITTVSASDADSGSYAYITYSIPHSAESLGEKFTIDELTGEIKLSGVLDFEKTKQYQLNVQAKDGGGLSDTAKIIIEIIDVNDNAPSIAIMSSSNSIPENASPGTVIAVIKVQDSDSGNNGHVHCYINDNVPFEITSSSDNFYRLQTETPLDRETTQEYNITITATDEGAPPLSRNVTLFLKVSDVNDNLPTFEKSSYQAFILENNSPGQSVLDVKARDSDWNQNARVSYMLEEGTVNGASASSYVSVNSDSGVIHALRSFDYEQIKDFQLRVKAQDGGSPPLSSNVTVKIFIQDQNDNAPQILYPAQTGVSLVAEMVPRSADVGYLVTKVVAVDVDSGQNAWLSYKLLKATDRALFEVGLQNGEIRTVRPVTDKDAVKQRLTVVVEDNGQPSRSATVNVNVAVADSFPEVLSEFTDITHDKDYNDNLTFYLVLALAVVSFLFVLSVVVIISVKIYRWRQSRILYQSNLPVIPYYPPHYADVGGTGTLQHVYNYEVCRTTDSRKSDCKFLRPCSQSVLMVDPSSTNTMQHTMKEKNILDEFDSTEEKTPSDWHFSQNQRPGTSGRGRPQGTQERWHPHGNSRAGPRPEDSGAVSGTSPWPNPPTEAEQLQALMAAANEVSDATATLGQRYNPQFTLQNVPDYRQNVYIPGSTATLTANQQQPPQPALPQPPPPADAPKPAQTPASKKKSTKKDKK